jgi:hypothetical protein
MMVLLRAEMQNNSFALLHDVDPAGLGKVAVVVATDQKQPVSTFRGRATFDDKFLHELLPLVIGNCVRELSPTVRSRVKQHKTFLSTFSSLCLITVPWMKLSISQATLVALDAGSLFALLGCALLIHLVYLACNYGVARHALRLSLDMRKSLVIMTSQKTLPMAMSVLSFFPQSLGEPGLIAIPCIISHLVQLFVDAFLAARWAQVTVDTPSGPVCRWPLGRRAHGEERAEDAVQLTRHEAGQAASASISSEAVLWVEEKAAEGASAV